VVPLGPAVSQPGPVQITGLVPASAAQATSLAAPGTPGELLPGPLTRMGISLVGPSAAGGPSARDLARIDQVAKGFEETFLSTLLKQMRETLQPDTLFPGDNADVLGGMFDMFLSQHLAQAGSLGVADSVKRQLLQRYEATVHPAPARRAAGLFGRAVPPTSGA
jgi:hypothetical protein